MMISLGDQINQIINSIGFRRLLVALKPDDPEIVYQYRWYGGREAPDGYRFETDPEVRSRLMLMKDFDHGF